MNSLAFQLELGTKIIIDAVDVANLGLYVKIVSTDLGAPIEFRNVRYEIFEQSKRSGALELVDESDLPRAKSRTYFWWSETRRRFVEEISYGFETNSFTSSYSIIKGLGEA